MYDLSILKVLTYLRKVARKNGRKRENEDRVFPIFTSVGCGHTGVKINVVPYNLDNVPKYEIPENYDFKDNSIIITNYLIDKLAMDDKRVKISRMWRRTPTPKKRLRLNNGNWFTGYGGTRKKSRNIRSKINI